MEEYQYIPVSGDCTLCDKSLAGHPKCLYCRILIHDMSNVKRRKRSKYLCSCGLNHTKTSDGRFCQDCIEKSNDIKYNASVKYSEWSVEALEN